MTKALAAFYIISLSITLIMFVISLVGRKKELRNRSLTLIALIHVACVVIWLGPYAFTAFMLLVASIGAVELSLCSGAKPLAAVLMAGAAVVLFLLLRLSILFLYAMFAPVFVILILLFLPKALRGHTRSNAWIFLLGMVVPCAVALSRVFDKGSGHVIAILFLVQFNDAVAYLAGSRIGKNKIAFLSAISPNKTVEGYLSGALGILVAAVLLHFAIPVFPVAGMPKRLLLLTACVFVFANAGDLAFSSMKRRMGVKDFSRILSGHGGVLDRFDSILCLAPVYLLLVTGGVL